MVTLTLPIHVPSALATIIGSDARGADMSETVEVPDLTPEQLAAATRAARMLDKIDRGAYRTRGREAKALRRYFRVALEGGAVAGRQRFARVSRIVFTSAGTLGSAPVLFGYDHTVAPIASRADGASPAATSSA